MMRAVVVDSVRTGIARAFQGDLRTTRSDDLAAHCFDALLERNPGLPALSIDDCIVGCAFPEGTQGLNLAKNVAVLSKLGETVPGCTISRYCASGLDAVAFAASRVVSGHAEGIIVGGVESVSLTLRTLNTVGLFNPRIARKSPASYLQMNVAEPGVPFWKQAFRSMGATAEILAERYGIPREEQDAYAVASQERTATAQRQCRFEAEIVPFNAEANDGATLEVVRVASDSCARPDTTAAVLAALEPAFRQDGTVTAGNAAPAADGAAACLVVSEALALRHQLQRLGYFLGYATVACEPALMGSGPARAIPKLLAAHNLRLEQIDLLEVNEAFAVQVVYCLRTLGLGLERTNVNGGAISVGHPFGMTGVRLVGQLLRELRRRGGRFGVVAMCVGGGMGVAALLEAAE
ncbi:MAG: hypothetical protein RJA70_1515 [Pseudomonadota bacterium]|jgi:acetyl-CoA acyltransferase